MLNQYLGLAISTRLEDFKFIEEIRIRLNQPLSVLDISGLHETDFVTDKKEIDRIFSSLCNFSVYARQQEIKNGFITLAEGHRVGICGRCILENNKITNISGITSLNIRISREIRNCALPIYDAIKNNIDHTVIISPPNCGKTTYLRDLTRLFSNDGINISVVDERGEIAPIAEEINFDLGKNTDVLQFCPKSIGMIMVLRTMNPKIIVTDEIGSLKDGEAITEMAKSGIVTFTSFHGNDVNDFKRRFKNYGAFKYAVMLNSRKEVDKILCLR